MNALMVETLFYLFIFGVAIFTAILTHKDTLYSGLMAFLSCIFLFAFVMNMIKLYHESLPGHIPGANRTVE